MTVRLVTLVSLAEGVTDSAAQELTDRLSGCADSVDEVQRAHAGLHIPGSFGGDLTWDLLFENDAALDAFRSRGSDRSNRSNGSNGSNESNGSGLVDALGSPFADLAASVASTDSVVVEPIDQHVGRRDLAGVKRTLLFQVRSGTPKEPLAHFERDMLGMPSFVPAIRNWSFGRVRGGASGDWTHIWEQEFENVDGLLNDYMMSPYHWGHLDAWYDPECPHSIVDPRVAHVYCPASDGVLSWSSG